MNRNCLAHTIRFFSACTFLYSAGLSCHADDQDASLVVSVLQPLGPADGSTSYRSDPQRLSADIQVTRTVETPLLWVNMTPCDFVSLTEGSLARYRVIEMFSRQLDRGFGGPTPVTFARLGFGDGTTPGSPVSQLWVAFDGGAISDELVASADVAIAVGDTAYVVLSDQHWAPALAAYDINAAQVFVELAPFLLETSAGLIEAPGPDTLAALSDTRTSPARPSCPLEWAGAVTPIADLPTPRAEGWVTLSEDDGSGDDGAVHFPDLNVEEIQSEPTSAH